MMNWEDYRIHNNTLWYRLLSLPLTEKITRQHLEHHKNVAEAGVEEAGEGCSVLGENTWTLSYFHTL
jgi:hypothetical protein